jgi:hypothetical protein
MKSNRMDHTRQSRHRPRRTPSRKVERLVYEREQQRALESVVDESGSGSGEQFAAEATTQRNT